MMIGSTAWSDPTSVFRESSIRRLILGGALLVAAIAIGRAGMVGTFQERALESSERELENTVLLLARHFDQQFEDVEFVEKDIISYVNSQQILTSENFKRRMSGQDVHEMLVAKINALKYVGGINIFDSGGTLINSSGAWPVLAVSIADRPYFKVFQSGPQSPELRVDTVHSRITGDWMTVFARKVVGPNGEFLGAIGRGVEARSFERFFASVSLGKDTTISMYDHEGTLLAHHPHIDSMIGRNFKSGPLSHLAESEAGQGTMRLISPIDGLDKLSSVRRLSNYPISIIATTTVSAALVDSQQQTRFLIGAAGLSILVIVVILVFVVRKLSQRHQLETRRLDTAINNMTQGLLLFDSSARLVISNRRYTEMYGLSPGDLKPGQPLRDVVVQQKATGSFTGDVDEYCATVMRDVASSKSFLVNLTDGRSIEIQCQPVLEGDWVATHEDITERRRSDQRIAHMAHYDALTDLPNRALLREQLERELTRIVPGEQLAVLYLDIDEFKSVNESLGHLAGDELLKAVAASLVGCIRTTDFIARLGGDEFAIFQTAVKDPADVIDLITRIYGAIRSPYDCLGHSVIADASIGIAMAPQHGIDLNQILKNADPAMYAAKSAGRRTWRFFEPEMDARVKARRVLEMDLRQAISDGGFDIHYQPCVNLRDNEITGCEALLRWRHPERGMISPAEFIPVAEETGLINQLGELVLNTACAEAATWPDNIKLAVNVSPAQFRNGTLASKVMGALATSGLSAADPRLRSPRRS
jgi:diguanylate cyclase (GGDEF)-like protein